MVRVDEVVVVGGQSEPSGSYYKRLCLMACKLHLRPDAAGIRPEYDKIRRKIVNEGRRLKER